MSKKALLVFIILFTVSYLALRQVSAFLTSNQNAFDSKQVNIIQENIRDRFKLFLKLPLSVAILGAEKYSEGFVQKTLSKSVHTILDLNSEMLGFSILNAAGTIVKAYPKEKNPHAVGKTTQNLNIIMESYKRGDIYWLSPPFELYQGQRGFVIYVPIIDNNKLEGWFASVISSEQFFKMFNLAQFLNSYELLIKDDMSREQYYSSTLEIPRDTKIFEAPMKVLGRNITFISWRKGSLPFNFPWYLNFITAIFIAGLSTFVLKLFEQRRKVQKQLSEIRALLRLTSGEALSKIVDLHTDFNELNSSSDQKENFSRNITYLSNLIEQVDLLHDMSQSKDELNDGNYDFLSRLEEQSIIYAEVINKKRISLQYKSKDFDQFDLSLHRGLLQSNVLSNILAHCLIYAQEGSALIIENQTDQTSYLVSFHVTKINALISEAIRLDRRMEVTSRILNIYQGRLILQSDMEQGFLVKLELPLS